LRGHKRNFEVTLLKKQHLAVSLLAARYPCMARGDRDNDVDPRHSAAT